ncbi:MAG: dipeptide epimerase [Planctomycetota bacterium]|nr:MAG: dipeptide epimerase [Planctomycetota bacterium]
MELKIYDFELPLRHTFRISRGSSDTQDSIIVELTVDGISGFGEATTNYYYGVTKDSLRESLLSVSDYVKEHTFSEPTKLWSELKNKFDLEPFALCAIDLAAYDLWGKINDVPTYQLLGLSLDTCPDSDYTIGIDTIEKMVEKLNEFSGWSIYKIKLGTKEDLEIMKELRRHTDAIFRIDANCGWTAEETITNAVVLKDLGAEFIEQPLKADDWHGMKAVHEQCCLPVIADESCVVESDVEKCAGIFDGVNIKLTKCGGITPALRMIEKARSLNLKTMVGCMVESTVGISGIAQILPLLDYVDMDGAVLISKDIASGVKVIKGKVEYSSENGSGIKLL